MLSTETSTFRAFLVDGDEETQALPLSPPRRRDELPDLAEDICAFGVILDELRAVASLDETTSLAWEQVARRCQRPADGEAFTCIQAVLDVLALSDATVTLGATAAPAPVSGLKHWGNFQLLQQLGAGSFGEVYRAWDPVLEREVALKLLLRRGNDSGAEYAAVVAEARALARVRHPNIVTVHGVDRQQERVGFWSDFIRGKTLADMVATEGPCSAKKTAEIGISLCDALIAVHDAGLLHRDIKPGNAMLSEDGRVLLMDFGLSQERHRAGETGGTLPYMAPELFAGQPASVSTDIFALGVLLLYLSTGSYVLKPSTEQRSASGLMLPPELREVIRRATAPDPLERFASAAKVREALGILRAATAPATRNRRSRRIFIGAGAAAVLILALLGAIYRKQAHVLLAGANPVAYKSYLAAEDALMRFDKPGNVQKARKLYQETLDRSPDFALAHAGMARADWRIYLDSNDKKWAEAATAEADRAAALLPGNAIVQMTVGILHVSQARDNLGMQELEKASELAPKTAEIRGWLAEAYRQQGRDSDAKAELQAAIDLAPQDWRYPYWLGALQLDKGEYANAEASLKLALEDAPDSARVLYDLGLLYERQFRLDEAARTLQAAVKEDPNYYQSTIALANTLVEQGRFDEAVSVYKDAARLHPSDWKLWGNMADAWKQAGRSEEASDDYRKAIQLATTQLELTPDEAFLVSRLGKFYAMLGDQRRALPLLRRSLRLAPSDPQVVERVAESYEQIGDRAEALTLITRALQLGFSPEGLKHSWELRELRKDPRAPQQIRNLEHH